MNKYNKDNGRKNLRLHGYDYSRAGLYFLTLVVQNRLHLFGYIEKCELFLNDAGIMIEKWYREIENKFPDKRCHEMVVMPNHFHCIIENMAMDATYRDATYRDATYRDAHVGAPLRGRPMNDDGCPMNDDGRSINDDGRSGSQSENNTQPNEKYGMHNIVYGATIGDVMDWFKTMTTNEYIRGVKNNNWQRYEGKLWQRNYYDNIIRDWQDDVRIAAYIIENPAKWKADKFNI